MEEGGWVVGGEGQNTGVNKKNRIHTRGVGKTGTDQIHEGHMGGTYRSA